MDRITKLVSEILKPKASSLGFNKEELESVAETLANNLNLDESISDEEAKEAVTKSVDAYLPLLQISQKNANRIITKSKEDAEREVKEREERLAKEKAEREAKEKADKEAREKAEKEAKEKAEREEKERKLNETFNEKPKEDPKNDDKSNALFENVNVLIGENKKLSEQLKLQSDLITKITEESKKRESEFKKFRDEFNTIRSNQVKESRAKRLDDLLKDTGVFGERIKKNYARMSFDKDEDFDTFLTDIKGDIEAFNQERANQGLDKMGISAVGGDSHKDEKPEAMTDAEIEALAAIM